MSFRRRMAWLICSGFVAVILSDHARAGLHDSPGFESFPIASYRDATPGL